MPGASITTCTRRWTILRSSSSTRTGPAKRSSISISKSPSSRPCWRASRNWLPSRRSLRSWRRSADLQPGREVEKHVLDPYRSALSPLPVSPETHLLASWIIAAKTTDNPRDCRLVTLAGILPDVDGLGLIVDAVTRAAGHGVTNLYQ